MGAAYVNVMWSNFGMMRCYVVLSGDLTVAGTPSNRIPGVTFKQKRNDVLRMTVDDVSKLINDGGWMVKFTHGVDPNGHCAVCIPTGFLPILVGSNCRAIRWPLSPDSSDSTRAKHATKSMMDSFPEELGG